MAYELLRVSNKREYRILVLCANVVHERQRSFEKNIKKRLPYCTVTVNEQPYHSKSKAKEVIQQILDAYHKQSFPYDGVFCTNDEMALGVVECLTENEKYIGVLNTVVIGYDAIKEAQNLINSNHHYLKNSVYQNVETLAKEGVDLFFKLASGCNLENRVILLPPESYKPLS